MKTYNHKQFSQSEKNILNNIILKNKINLIIKFIRNYKKNKIEKNLTNKSISIKNNSNENINSSKSTNNNNNDSDINLVYTHNASIFNNGIIPISNSYKHQGYQMNNQKDGYGYTIWKNNNKKNFSYFSGIYYKNLINGNGKYVKYINNIPILTYEGEFSNNKANGYGILIIKEKGYYNGIWKNDKQNNIGIEEWNDGSKYEGLFLLGKKTGIGKYIWKDKAFYYGEWLDNYLEGWGVYTFSDGKKYLGQWHKNTFNGYGELIWDSSRMYIGYFKNNQRNGFGLLIFRNKEKAYCGFWKDNKQHGLGKISSKNKENYYLFNKGVKEKIYEKIDFLHEIEKNNLSCYLGFFKYGYKGLDMFISVFKMN